MAMPFRQLVGVSSYEFTEAEPVEGFASACLGSWCWPDYDRERMVANLQSQLNPEDEAAPMFGTGCYCAVGPG